MCLDELKHLTVKNIILSKQIHFLNYPNRQKSEMAAKIWKFSTQTSPLFNQYSRKIDKKSANRFSLKII